MHVCCLFLVFLYCRPCLPVECCVPLALLKCVFFRNHELHTCATSAPHLPLVHLQTTLLRRLPAALHKGFIRCNEEACRKFKHGGTTATLAIACGWELLVANVGDSCAYLDTGAEVLQVGADSGWSPAGACSPSHWLPALGLCVATLAHGVRATM